ncbi:MAG TPA: serine/threonine-protein kinase [Polyangiaceae bacterium]|nr:serine/threonine-protein kinase [Polyangiaceae bacterium]
MADASSGADPDAPDLEGTTLQGVWQIRRHIGVGAMGQVYEARHTEDGPARAAVKVLHKSLLANREVSYRFRREAEILEVIESPHVPRVFDRGKDPLGRPFMVMELISGVELSRVLEARGTLPVPLVVEISRQVCRALTAAHRAGIVHRDLKPENVMLCGGSWSDSTALGAAEPPPPEVKLLDFSVSKVEDLAFTNAGALLGTPSYMPPEQARGESATPKVDIYAVGAVAYEMLTGRPPFDSPDPGKTLALLLTEEAPAPRALVPSIPPKIEAVILRAIEKDPSRRYPTAAALEADLAFALLPDVADEDAPETARVSAGAPAPASSSTGGLLGRDAGERLAERGALSIGAAVIGILAGGFVAVALTMLAWVFSGYAFPRWVAVVAWLFGAGAGLVFARAARRAQSRRAL